MWRQVIRRVCIILSHRPMDYRWKHVSLLPFACSHFHNFGVLFASKCVAAWRATVEQLQLYSFLPAISHLFLFLLSCVRPLHFRAGSGFSVPYNVCSFLFLLLFCAVESFRRYCGVSHTSCLAQSLGVCRNTACVAIRNELGWSDRISLLLMVGYVVLNICAC
jgi:hypothetical protein